MGKVQDLLASFVGDDGVAAYPDDLGNQIQVAYDDDFSIPAAKIAEMESVNKDSNTIINALKAQNYDLLMQVGSADPDDSAGGTVEADDADNPDSIDSLFDEDDN